ncbi:ESX secretion-associated protein EspG [Nocardia sp. BSTN01]|uniref:ESX secretion-associated protein EspG n=1 Tax=Nocardia sp. BSTN01 TaxID=2783665 RepID=UPI00188DF5AC|nr:ESX secretion-associated protein EspG [Nocardia sp. BSTN01]MBF4995712.1 ESX secretion-associated protein EspG [Nocardia sp. BSTN01]
MNRWTLTDLEFKVLCDTRFFGLVPSMFSITSRIPYLDDYEREWRRTRAELESRGDSAFEAIVDTMVLPEVLVGGEAWEDSDFDNPAKRVRFYAGRLGSRGFVVVQLPGETLKHAEGFTITACDPRALGETVVGLLPVAEPGRRGPIEIQIGESVGRPSGGGSMVADDEDDDYRGLTSAAFFAIPATHTGTVRLTQGRSKFGPRGRISVARLWRDLPGDGRYVIPLEEPAPVAVGMGSSGLIDWIDTEAEHIVQRMNDYQEVDE